MSSPVQALAGVPNACQVLPGVVTGGQPSPSHLAALHAVGGAIVLDLRDPMERRPFDEPAAVAAQGMEYVNIPVGPGTLTDQTIERVLAVLRGAGDRLVLVHCGSGNRVGAALIPHLILDHEMEEEDAVGQAMRVGLRSAELMEWGLDYARRNKKT
ncbi:MAG TPA: sulfur transferase domain-containing protein [Gemmatimonadales bacterium]